MTALTAQLICWSDNLLVLSGLADGVTGEAVEDAAVAVTLYNPDGMVPLGGETWPLVLTPVEGEAGTYRATIGYALAVTPGQNVVGRVTADAGVKRRRRWDLTVTVIAA